MQGAIKLISKIETNGRVADPFRMAPNCSAYEARDRFSPDPSFDGRVAAVVFIKDGQSYVLYECERFSDAIKDPLQARENDLWPVRSMTEVEETIFTDGRRETFSFREFLLSRLRNYPQKDFYQGGREIAWRKGQLIQALNLAKTSAAVRVLNRFNRERVDETLVGLYVWQVGKGPSHEMRFDRTFYAPLSSGRELIERLLKGYDVAWVKEIPRAPIDILYEDVCLLVVNKPARLASVPSATEAYDAKTLLERFHGALYDVHRLDMATSGILVFAKTRETQAKLHIAFRSHEVKKTYVAVLEGVPKLSMGLIELPIGVDRLDRPRQCVVGESAGGRVCLTEYRVIEASGELSRVLLFPKTGRTHQLRVHCAHALGLNTPIAGDAFYGREGLANESPEKRLLLHASRIEFVHPETGRLLQIESNPDF